jgi:transcriptional regulator with XRE-family HTH domain
MSMEPLYQDHKLREISLATGISISYLSDIRRGRRTPSLEVAASLATYLGISVSVLYKRIQECILDRMVDIVTG